ncbi:MAG: putative VWA domain-containing protein [Streblomastix strix]|uniref:Putative VWA domain-containing protein n=1 Tax=Streblomastix strix TaxID=222440 RepID=A0A5J4V3Y0_9EUKA|nr:MAG: putative VWA domain-containing protein [Streblomastix strix]
MNFLQHTIDSSVRAIPTNQINVKVNVLITITAPKAVNAVERAPVCVILVIDKSGSMQMENKLPHAIEAGQVLIDQLEQKDKLGIVEFDDKIVVRQEITPAKDKERLKRVLAGIQIGGFTNISDALIRAQQMLAGPTAQGAKAIGNVAGQHRDEGITASSIGVGLDYDEATMQKIAQLGGGNFYHVREALELVGILQAELNLAKELMTRRTKVKYLRPASVLSVKVHGYAIKVKNAKPSGKSQGSDAASAFKDETTIQMSDFSSEEIRQILIELLVDPTSAKETEPDQAKNLSLGILQLRFSRTEESPIEEIKIPLSILVDDDETRRDATNNAFAESIEKVAAEVMSAEANQAHDRAMMELEAGHIEQSRQILQENEEQMEEYQSSMPAFMSRTPQYQAINQQRMRFQQSRDSTEEAENDVDLRRNMRLQGRQMNQQMAQGYYSSSNQAQIRANDYNQVYTNQPRSNRKSQPVPSPLINQSSSSSISNPYSGISSISSKQISFGPSSQNQNQITPQQQLSKKTPSPPHAPQKQQQGQQGQQQQQGQGQQQEQIDTHQNKSKTSHSPPSNQNNKKKSKSRSPPGLQVLPLPQIAQIQPPQQSPDQQNEQKKAAKKEEQDTKGKKQK